ncbi:hypothetical protein MASR1M90_07460 [Desulfovibrionales bacterium]
MRKIILLVLLIWTGCGHNPVDVSMQGVRYQDDAPVLLSELLEAVTPDEMPDTALRAVILPFAVRQDIGVRKEIGKEIADIFRLVWLEERVFSTLEYDVSRPWPGLDPALDQAQAKGANILVCGNVTQLYQAAAVGRTSLGLSVEIYWVPTRTLIWSAAQAAAMEGAQDKDFIVVRTARRVPENPLFAVTRALGASMAQGFTRHLLL